MVFRDALSPDGCSVLGRHLGTAGATACMTRHSRHNSDVAVASTSAWSPAPGTEGTAICARLHMDGARSCWPMQGLGVGRRTKWRSGSDKATKSCRAL